MCEFLVPGRKMMKAMNLYVTGSFTLSEEKYTYDTVDMNVCELKVAK